MTFKVFYKLVKFILFLVSYFVSSILILIASGFSMNKARIKLTRNISRHSKLGLWLLGIKIKEVTSLGEYNGNYLIVCNHLSYLDILIIASRFPTCFVTSIEMKNTPLLGQMCSLGGCLFVERRSKLGLSNEIKNLTQALRDKMNVTVFPEATSTNGQELFQFKRPLFQAAVDANKKVLPLCLNYRKANGEKITVGNRDLLFWYGDMTFFPHFIEFLKLDDIEVELNELPLIEVSNQTKEDLALKSYEAVKNEFIPIRV